MYIWVKKLNSIENEVIKMKNKQTKKIKRIIIFSSIGLALFTILLLFKVKNSNQSIQVETFIAKEDSVQTFVTATGYVQPVDKVNVGTQVSGVIEHIYVNFNSIVKKGQLLAELDRSTLVERLNQAKASLKSAESDLHYTQQNYNRIKELYEVKAATKAEIDDANNRLIQAETAMINAQANVQQAEVNLSYAQIYSPIDGVILDKAVGVGQTVAASFSTPTLFTIANDLTKMQVEANVDEADIGMVQVGQTVTFTVDAYQNIIFKGEVKQIRLQPTVSNNVVTYTVVVDAPNPDERLFPGMTASISIITNSNKGVAIPVTAVNLLLSPEIAKKMNISNEEMLKVSDKIKSVWIKQDEKYYYRNIQTGLNDGVTSIITEGLQVGEEVVTAVHFSTANSQEQAANLFMPKPPGR